VDLPCYAVGEASAAAARSAGYKTVRVGGSDGAAAAAGMARDGIRHALHLCGREHIAVGAQGVQIDRRVIYAAEPVARLSAAALAALDRGALALLHSPRAASLFATLIPQRDGVGIAAISAAVAAAAGEGWAGKSVAAHPRDEALLELAVQLCQTAGDATG
jgi:uroporphyrinogen-III synthase